MQSYRSNKWFELNTSCSRTDFQDHLQTELPWFMQMNVVFVFSFFCERAPDCVAPDETLVPHQSEGADWSVAELQN